MKFGLTYAKISNKIIDFIKQNELNTTERIKTINDFKQGDNVQITEGIFKDYIAIFDSIRSDDRVILLMNIMGRRVECFVSEKLR